ncbi:hypothetical protein PTTG_03848 [Puccinia triticina 1-1 BBBD Race 1]|uniref:Nudix hydrolase domain-containing protein n=2 Tax=Puccinia triticina TaxID=208348 RepID=A0A0C4ESR9_PUCT1|nr:uncharacterized protein PtA15_9A34 [Puccinia triticina]OAV89721.1 hypothetical protein PTTG_03848 [Puccinia triticina 1-1 BBBD Race 1]WAQ87910.1 hypothetical protein PtA15_9A34 [Puccinia triticina]WAR60099.1 hypothetical protein PtB15_9B36 [Puccinia triticina]
MSFLAVLEQCHNHPTLGGEHPAGETLVPLYLHLPDNLAGLSLRRLPPPPPIKRLTTRRTSSSSSAAAAAAAGSQKFKPLSSYLTRSNSSDQLDNNPFFNEQAYQPPWDQAAQDRDARQPIGFLRPAVLKALIQDNQHMNRIHSQACWKLFYPPDQGQETGASLPARVSFEDWINQAEDRIETRQEHLDRLVRGWKEIGLFADQLSGWRNEVYSVYGPKDDSLQLPGANLAFRIERAAVGLFGFLSFGVHLTAYIKKDGQYLFWIPRRSATKATWPSKLDNTVAGGITSGESGLDTIIRECFEEASLDEETVRSRIRPTGLISYTHRSPEGWIQPEIQYTYDLELPAENTIVPKPNDGESEAFRLMTFDELAEALRADSFKPNSAAVLVDFFVRHGLLSETNEPNYVALSTLVKQPVFLPLP